MQRVIGEHQTSPPLISHGLRRSTTSFAAASESTAKKRKTGNAPSIWERVAELAHPMSAVSDPPSDHDRKGMTSRCRSWPRRLDALTVHSSAVKSKWVRWKGKNDETRAGRPCKDATLNVSVLKDIAKFFSEGAFLKPSAARLQHQEVWAELQRLAFWDVAKRTFQPILNAWSCNLNAWAGKGPAA